MAAMPDLPGAIPLPLGDETPLPARSRDTPVHNPFEAEMLVDAAHASEIAVPPEPLVLELMCMNKRAFAAGAEAPGAKTPPAPVPAESAPSLLL